MSLADQVLDSQKDPEQMGYKQIGLSSWAEMEKGQTNLWSGNKHGSGDLWQVVVVRRTAGGPMETGKLIHGEFSSKVNSRRCNSGTH